MKNLTYILVVVLIATVFLVMGSSKTRMSSCVLVDTYTADGSAEGALGVLSLTPAQIVSNADVDLMSLDGGGKESHVNHVALMFASDDAEDSVWVVMVYGAVDNGTWEPIASLSVTIGTALRQPSTTYADAITVTDYHIASVTASTTLANTVARVTFDATGYRYLRIRCTTEGTSATNLYTYMRWF